MIDLNRLRSTELIYHDYALRDEFKAWREQADGPLKPFAKHQSQIERITCLLEETLKTIDATNVAAAFDPQETAYSHLLGIYRIWSYFRSKFMMRNHDRLGDILRCADELAWACYEPAYKQAKATGVIDVGQLKQPPLVFFSGDASPFAQERATPFEPEGLSERNIIDFEKLISSLPIPVVGVPWFHLNHLPAISVVAHEVAHAVELDFQLKGPPETLFARPDIDPDRRKAWAMWYREIFADVYGCICMGPAFLLSLIAYLFGDREEVQKEERGPNKWGNYPTRTLRIMLNIETLDQLKLLSPCDKPQECTEPKELGAFLTNLRQVWQTSYPQYRMKPFKDDIKAVVSALLDAQFNSFGAVALRDLVQYKRKQLVDSWYLSDDILANRQFPAEAKAWSFCVLAAAPALAYARNPQRYYEVDSQATVLRSLLAAIPEGVRAIDPDRADVIAKKQAADREMGRKLVTFFTKKVPETPQE